MHSADQQHTDTGTTHPNDEDQGRPLPTGPGTDADGTVWKQAPAPHGDYLVGSDGRVVSLKRKTPHKMKPKVNRYGYEALTLCDEGKQTWAYVARLVQEAHRGPIPPNHHVHHINGRRRDNRLENLEAVPATKHRRGHSAKLSEEEVAHAKWILNFVDVPHRAIADHFGVSQAAIQITAAGRIWKDVEPKRPDAATIQQVREAA
jgi:hypothetical protein